MEGDIHEMQSSRRKKGSRWPSPKSRHNAVDLEAGLSGRVDELATVGVSPSGIATLKNIPIKCQEDLQEIDESTLRNFPLSTADLSIIFALRTNEKRKIARRKNEKSSLVRSASSGWERCYEALETKRKVPVVDAVDSMPGDDASTVQSDTYGSRCFNFKVTLTKAVAIILFGAMLSIVM